MKTTLLIWSKNRAPQLELLLDSIYKNSSIDFNIHVLYTFDNIEAEKNYNILISSFSNINFHKEYNFREQTLDIIKNGEENICLGCDDNIFHKKMALWPESLEKIQAGSVYSLRCGFNTVLQDHVKGLYQPALNQYILGDILSWCPQSYLSNNNYGYPFSLDFHIYNRDQLLSLAESVEWNNTNTLEGNLTRFNNEIYIMYSFPASISCSIPLNCLSGQTAFSPKPEHTIEYLNRQFSFGKRLRLIPNQKIIGCHQLLNLHWS